LQRRKTRTRRLELGAALAAACFLGGCGSGSDERAAPPPKLPAAIARSLAAESDAVASALRAGDSCAALQRAEHLQTATIDAINSRRVPTAFQEQLASSVGDLVSRIQCMPAEKEHKQGKHEKKRKHKGKRKGKGRD
jgi:outer membrane murein-binding lipoprotein Lpp